MPEARWGNWHRGLIVGEDAEDITIAGQGVIDGNKVFDAAGEERMRGPHTIVFVNCRQFTLRDVSIVNAANYAVFFQASDDVDIRDVTITGGWDGVHFRGPGTVVSSCQYHRLPLLYRGRLDRRSLLGQRRHRRVHPQLVVQWDSPDRPGDPPPGGGLSLLRPRLAAASHLEPDEHA